MIETIIQWCYLNYTFISKKDLKKPKSEVINRRRAENAMTKRKKDKRTNNNLTKIRTRRTSPKQMVNSGKGDGPPTHMWHPSWYYFQLLLFLFPRQENI
jgi:hypothetical protein